ncbi:TerB family tellurite resistance protein [Photobacterium leiognathi]|uniref:TerB family tellurite resistance protein n=1 Tax=Photobacterium leiognathi TaxID=553611 RepID=UPI0029813CE8|nr:TerB family tellurite resistance protein [Photobacterium leiognathi]
MFIQQLNVAQQAALFCFSKQLIAADNNIDDRELFVLETIKAQCDTTTDFEATVQLSSLSALFIEPSQKAAFMFELIGVAYADEQIQESEQMLISQIAEILNIATSHLEEIKNWVQRQLILVNEAKQIMER